MPGWTLTTTSAEETRRLGRLVGEEAAAGEVVLLYGDLGAGKTCLAQGIAEGLGVPPEEPVTSPSFTLMNHHRGRLDLYHFDLYRLTSADDLVELGFEEYLHGPGVAVVEWADRFPGLDRKGLAIRLEHGGEERRRITVKPRGERSEELLERLCGRWQEKKARLG